MGKGQISAEMLIVLAVLVAVAVFLAMQLTSLGKKSANQTQQSMQDIICQQACLKEGLPCTDENVPEGLICEDGVYVIDEDVCPPCSGG